MTISTNGWWSTPPHIPDFFSLTVPQVNPQTVPVMVSPLTVRVKFTCPPGASEDETLKISVESSSVPSRMSGESVSLACPSLPNTGITPVTLWLPVTLVPCWDSWRVIWPLPTR
jgi:hypothetical protein